MQQRGQRWRRPGVTSYLGAMLVVFVVLTLVGMVYVRRHVTAHERGNAITDAGFEARMAAESIDGELADFQEVVGRIAAKPGLAAIMAAPASCTLAFPGRRVFAAGHLDLIGTNGQDLCSSSPPADPFRYDLAALAPGMLTTSTLAGPVIDERTGRRVVVLSAPVPGSGVVAVMLDVDSLGPGLASAFAGPRDLELLVVTGDGRQIVSRSIDPGTWQARSTDGTPFGASSQAIERDDVDGHARLYQSSASSSTGWVVYAGADRASTLAAADELNGQVVAIALLMMLGMALTTYLVGKRITTPIHSLSQHLAGSTGGRIEPVALSGPRELAYLAECFNRLTMALNEELDNAGQLAAIVESSSDSIIGRSSDGVITSWNAGAERMYGFPADEAIGLSKSLIVPEDRADELASVDVRVDRGESVPTFDTQRLRNDGSTIEVAVTVSPIKDRQGAVVGASTVGRDVSVRHATEARLRFQADLLDSAGQAIIATDGAAAISYWNTAAERMYGWAADEAEGRLLAEVLPSDASPEQIADVTAALLAGETWSGDFSLRRRDGTTIPVFVTNTPMMDDGGSVTGVIGVSSDLSERRALEDRLHQTQRLESLGQLAGGVAHDFNNLLTVILNYGAFIEESTTGETNEHAHLIVTAAEGAARLTRQLLTFARREPMQLQALDLNVIVAEVKGLLARTIGEDVHLVVHPSDVPLISADRGQTEQVLLNLAANARDAMPLGGTLTIETATASLDEGYLRFHPEAKVGDYVRLSVSDTGTGMSAAVSGHAFEPFFTTKPKGSGTGLGLATVYGILAAAGGSVNLYSEEGIGTTISVYFPVIADGDGHRSRPPVERVAGQGQVVLVVEDQPAVRAVTVSILRRNGYAVLQAAGAAGALALAAEHEFALLLTDVVMPEVSGLALADAIRAAHPGSLVLYMSGYSDGILGPTGALGDDDALIHKPFSEQQLLTAVAVALQSPQRSHNI